MPLGVVCLLAASPDVSCVDCATHIKTTLGLCSIVLILTRNQLDMFCKCILYYTLAPGDPVVCNSVFSGEFSSAVGFHKL